MDSLGFYKMWLNADVIFDFDHNVMWLLLCILGTFGFYPFAISKHLNGSPLP